MSKFYDFTVHIVGEIQSDVQSLVQQADNLEKARKSKDRNARQEAEKEIEEIHQRMLKGADASIVYLFLTTIPEANADGFRSTWQKDTLAHKDKPLQQLRDWKLEDFYKSAFEQPKIDLSLLPFGAWFLQFTFTLAKPYISKDDNPFYIIDNPIVRDKVFRLPMIRPTSWKGNLYAALWQLGHDKQDDAQMQRLFGETRGEESGQAGRLYFYPTFFTQTGLEIINPHDRKRRVGKNPILFECVPAGAQGTFSLLYVPFDLIGEPKSKIHTQALADLQLVAEGIKEMMLTYGFSAKRTSGFGVAQDSVKSETEPARLVIKLTGVTFSQANPLSVQQPDVEFQKYLDENGQVKTVFKGSGEGGLMSNNEYKQTGAQHGGGSLSEFKKFRDWYIQYGEQWKNSLQRGQTRSEYPQTSFDSLSPLVELCQNLQNNATNGGAA